MAEPFQYRLPIQEGFSAYAELAAKGTIRLTATTTSDLDRIPRYAVAADLSPLDLLLAARAEDDR